MTWGAQIPTEATTSEAGEWRGSGGGVRRSHTVWGVRMVRSPLGALVCIGPDGAEGSSDRALPTMGLLITTERGPTIRIEPNPKKKVGPLIEGHSTRQNCGGGWLAPSEMPLPPVKGGLPPATKQSGPSASRR